MALTIQATPAAYSSVHDNLIYTVYSDKVQDPETYPNYKFIADVLVDSVLVARIKKIPNPLTGIGIFNVGQIVRAYVLATFNPTPAALVAQTLGSGEFFVDVRMSFGEEIDYEPEYDITFDSIRFFYNHYNGRLVGQASALVPFIDFVASNRPNVGGEVLSSTAFYFVPYFPGSTGSFNVVVTPNVGSGFTQSISVSASNLKVFNVAPMALNAHHAGTITAATTSYTVQIRDQTYRFKVICEPIYEVFALHFLNKYGGFDTKLFNKVSRRSVDINKRDYGLVNYQVDESGEVTDRSETGVYYETRSVYSSQFVERLRLNTDLLTDGEYRWLEQLVISPMVYLEESGYFLPVQIKENSYEAKKVINDDLTSLELSVEYGTTHNSQSR